MQELAVDKPAINEVLDRISGDIIPAREAIGRDYSKTLQLRMALKEGIAAHSPIYLCPLCGIPIYLVSQNKRRRFFFRHEIEDGRCPARTKGKLSENEINALRYHGKRESRAHVQMKEIIAECLRIDPEFSNVEIEPIWKGKAQNERRRPDVRAIWHETIPVAFEVQLSTTFLRVIAERRQFYLREGGLLLWVFKAFNENDSPLTQEDVFYNNNRNAFVVGEDTLKASLNSGGIVLDCRWSEPAIKQDKLVWLPSRRLVRFNELTINQPRQQIFFFNTDATITKAEDELKKGKLRSDFEHFWLAYNSGSSNKAQWQDLRCRFAEYALSLPLYPSDTKGPQHLLNALYTAKIGRPIGWGYNSLVEVAHWIEAQYKGFLWAFRLVLKAYERGKQVLKEDGTGNWEAKAKRYKEAMKNGDPAYFPDRRFDCLAAFLFPEIAADLPLYPNRQLSGDLEPKR